MLLTKRVEVGVNNRQIKYYESRGYKIPKYKDGNGKKKVRQGRKIRVKVGDLPKGSKVRVDVKCDGCEKILNVTYKNYNNYLREDGKYLCRCCSNSKNDKFIPISVSHPDSVKWFKNKDDTDRYSYGSGKRVNFVCIECRQEKEIIIQNFFNQGFACPRCSDGISIPEKYVKSLLDQLGAEYKYQFKIEGYNRVYDFLVEINNTKYLIEVDGGWHFQDNNLSGQSKEESQRIDREKNLIAINNGYKMIRVDARKSNFNYLRESITRGGLLGALRVNEKDVNWDKVGKSSMVSYMAKGIELYNSGTKIREISERLGLSSATIVSYIKNGVSIGICKHNRGYKRKVRCIEADMLFDSIVNAGRWANVSESGIRKCLAGRCKISGNYHWEYLDEGCEEWILCEETGIIFQTAQDAAKWLNGKHVIGSSNIINCLKGKTKTSGGYHWSYIY